VTVAITGAANHVRLPAYRHRGARFALSVQGNATSGYREVEADGQRAGLREQARTRLPAILAEPQRGSRQRFERRDRVRSIAWRCRA